MNNYIASTKSDRIWKNMLWLLFGAFSVMIIGIALAKQNWLYLVIPIVPYFIYFSVKHPFVFPFGLYVLLIPFNSLLDVIGFAPGATLTKLFGILTILVLSLKGAFEKKFIKPESASLVLMLFVVYCLLTSVWAINQDVVSSQVPTVLGLFIFYLIVSAYKIQDEDFNSLKRCIFIGGILAASFTIYSYQSGLFYGHSFRATMTIEDSTVNPNTIGFSLLMPLSICVQMMLSSRKKMHKIFLFSIFLLLSYVIVVTGSRKALLGIAIILAVYNTRIRNKLTFGTVALVAMTAVILIAPDYFTERIGQSLTDRGAGRLDIWDVGIAALQRYWLLGAGLGNFPLAFNKFVNEGGGNFVGFARDAHNIYLMVLVETGIIGLSLLLWTFKKHHTLLRSRLIQDDLNIVMLRASFWSTLLVGFFANIFLSKSFWLMLMMIAMYRNVSPKKDGIRFLNSRLK
jgi:O-antigen ligase